ncbi:unnamed protein product [Rotaria sordida]|uniref:Uncharacterized protein n=1 Tax=Rotaria sordida TaxID=392033 RepID=A0A814DC30_9BILA|nr:unnamed protein product [Rotaria sordida]CAF1420518.1 unnamed protein product [Rotaria sordida]CAF1601816.1 unnamed protein product [Rotaria sordida]CAF4040126.1 unnamed protein product [Rotaria sordida]
MNSEINEWILIRYCIDGNEFGNEFECYGNVELTFEELKLKNISGENLFQWNAPIDTINNYEKYLIENDFSMKNNFYCNCSKIFFGKDCSYSFDKVSPKTTFHEIITNKFDKKKSLTNVFEIVNDGYLLTCYEVE